MAKVAGDTSTCPPPSGVCDYGTDRYRKETARGESREGNIIYGSERGRKTKIIIIQGKTTRSSLTPQRLRERRGAGSGGCARACDRSQS